MGLSLAGGKTQKTHLSVIDYYPKEEKLFLSHLVRDIGEDGDYSSDTILLDAIDELSEDLQLLAIDAPLSLPKCLRCRLKCPGVEACGEPEIEWMWDHYQQRSKKRKPNKIFTPYTQRCVEQHVSNSLESPFVFDQALGSNRAPLWARAEFLQKRLKKKSMIEVFPRLCVWRVGRALKISKGNLKFYKNAVEGPDLRLVYLEKLLQAEWLFLYNQDVKQMVKDAFVFESVVSAFTAFLHYKKLTANRPKGFPKKAGWVVFPEKDFQQSLD